MPQHAVYSPITPHQRDALADLIVTLRPKAGHGPNRWTKVAVLRAIERAVDERTDDALLLIRAMTAGARRPAIIEPAQLADNGPHWDPEVLIAPGDPRKAATCLTCHGPIHPPEVPHYPAAAEIPDADRIREIRDQARRSDDLPDDGRGRYSDLAYGQGLELNPKVLNPIEVAHTQGELL